MLDLRRQSLTTVMITVLLASVLAGCQPIQRPTNDGTPTGDQSGETAPVSEGITAEPSPDVSPSFDIVFAEVARTGGRIEFRILVEADAGAEIPTPTGQLAGAEVFSYVWPTSLNSAAAGFAADQGILALAVTAHPDFDDTPLVDEDQDGDNGNDGALWHSHWVVLTPDDVCGPGSLKVKDIEEGEQPQLPPTWPELPLFIDSPDFEVSLEEATITAYVPLERLSGATTFNYDGVTAGLQVNANLHAPLLCVTNVYDVASGDLSLPGVFE